MELVERLRVIVMGPIQLKITLMQKTAEVEEATTPDRKPRSLACCFCLSKDVENSPCQKTKAKKDAAAPASVKRKTTMNLQAEEHGLSSSILGGRRPTRSRTCCNSRSNETAKSTAAHITKTQNPRARAVSTIRIAAAVSKLLVSIVFSIWANWPAKGLKRIQTSPQVVRRAHPIQRHQWKCFSSSSRSLWQRRAHKRSLGNLCHQQCFSKKPQLQQITRAIPNNARAMRKFSNSPAFRSSKRSSPPAPCAQARRSVSVLGVANATSLYPLRWPSGVCGT